MQKIYISLLLIITIISFWGCGGASGGNSELSGLSDREYKIVSQRLDFEKEQAAHMNFTVDSDTKEVYTQLLDAHTKIMYRIELPKNVKSVSFIQEKETKRVHLDKLLVPTKDYFYDSVNNAVFVALEIPYIYMLDKKIKIALSIGMADKRRKKLYKDVILYFETKPMRENGEDYMSFLYEESFESENVDQFILATIKRELQNANLKRFDKGYLQRHKTIFGLK